MNVTITKEDAFDLKMLREKLAGEILAERKRQLPDRQRTTEVERDAQHGLDVVNKILAQVP